MTNFLQLLQATQSPDPAVAAVARRTIAIRMARASAPDYKIAFILGLNLKLLHELYGPDMKRAAAYAKTRFEEVFYAHATSGKHPAATLLYAKMQHNAGNLFPKQYANKKKEEPKYPDCIPPDAILIIGPDGEPA